MELKVATVIICLCAFTITTTEAGIPKCCIITQKYLPEQMLLKVRRVYMQLSSGACDISALVLYVRDRKKPICAHLKLKIHLRKLQERMKRNKLMATH